MFRLVYISVSSYELSQVFNVTFSTLSSLFLAQRSAPTFVIQSVGKTLISPELSFPITLLALAHKYRGKQHSHTHTPLSGISAGRNQSFREQTGFAVCS